MNDTKVTYKDTYSLPDFDAPSAKRQGDRAETFSDPSASSDSSLFNSTLSDLQGKRVLSADNSDARSFLSNLSSKFSREENAMRAGLTEAARNGDSMKMLELKLNLQDQALYYDTIAKVAGKAVEATNRLTSLQ